MKFMHSIIVESLIFLPSCSEEADGDSSDNPDTMDFAAPDTLSQWLEWAEESGDGLWQDGRHRFSLEEARVYGGEDYPPFYNIEGLSFRGDTMYISDPTNQSLVAVSLETGEQLWLFGEAGEGPGHFNGIGEIAASESLVAACDIGNGKVVLVDTDGNLINEIRIGCPFDVMWRSDSLIVLSLAAGQPVNIYNSNGELLETCGTLPEELGILSHINRHLHGALDPGGNVLMISRFMNGIWRVDLDSGETEMLTEMVFPQGEMVNDIAAGAWMVLCRDIFLGPDGAVNVILPVFTESGGSIADGGELLDVTAIHRYDSSGDYLDSWTIGGTLGIALMHNGRLFTVDRYKDGVVRSWDIVR